MPGNVELYENAEHKCVACPKGHTCKGGVATPQQAKKGCATADALVADHTLEPAAKAQVHSFGPP